MINIILLVGLPGSGKTHFMKQCKEKDTNLICIDDISDKAEIEKYQLNFLKDNNMILSDVNFCDSKILVKAIEYLTSKFGPTSSYIDVLYFENDPIAAQRNVAYRNDGREVQGTIDRFTKIYNPPKTAMKIWRKND